MRTKLYDVLLLVLIVVVAFLAGFLSKEVYKQIVEEQNLSHSQQQEMYRQLTMPAQDDSCKTESSKQECEYQRVLKEREQEAAKIRAKLRQSTTTE